MNKTCCSVYLWGFFLSGEREKGGKRVLNFMNPRFKNLIALFFKFLKSDLHVRDLYLTIVHFHLNKVCIPSYNLTCRSNYVT